MRPVVVGLVVVAGAVALGIYLWQQQGVPSEATSGRGAGSGQTAVATSLPQSQSQPQSQPQPQSLTKPAGASPQAPGSAPLAQVKAVTEATPASDFYSLFRSVKAWLLEDPGAVAQVLANLETPGDDTPASRRQRSLLYGALAQTDLPSTAAALRTLVTAAKSAEDLVQAAAALGDHPHPGEPALNALWHQALSSEAPPAGKNAALLAYGSVAHHLGTAPSEVATQLLDLGAKAPSDSAKVEVMAAMGNHGSVAYLPFLQTAALQNAETVRAAAVFAARFLPDAAAWITATATKDASPRVKSEAVSALSAQLDQHATYQQIAAVALSSPAAELHLQVAKLLAAALQRQPDNPAIKEAQKSLAEGSPNPAVKQLLGL